VSLTHGTAPLDRLAAVGDPQLRRILLYARSRRAAFTVAEAADALDVHRNVARIRLDRLVEAGFLAVRLERPGGRRGPGAGRPAKVYRVAQELESVEFPDRRLAELVLLLVKKVPARSRCKVLREAGEDFGRELGACTRLKPARDLGTGLERVCDALGSLGFQVSVVSLETDRAELASPTCPLRPLVVKCPHADGIDHGMWAGLVEAGVRGLAADRIHCETLRCQSRDESCQILLAIASQERPSVREQLDRHT
jgi:predicted ArsR family transcriptional regulator